MATVDATVGLALRYSDSAGCRRWLARLPLGQTADAQRELAGQLAALRRTDIGSLERLRILETLRAAVRYVQDEAARSYAGKPLPLADAESDTWGRTVALWQDLGANYGSCLDACRNGDLLITPYVGLVALRCIGVHAALVEEHYRVYRQPGPAPWRTLNAFYQDAERSGYARLRIHDVFGQQDPDTTCQDVYVQALLLAAAHPYTLSVREQNVVRDWLAQWSPLLALHPQPPPAGKSPALAVDLASAAGARTPAAAEPSTTRHLDLEPLAHAVRQALDGLKQGRSPTQLGLGSRLRPAEAEQLLGTLHTQWFRAGAARGEDRLDTEERSTVCFGLDAAHYQATRGSSADHTPGDRDCAVETWFIRNYSSSGFMCMTRHPDSAVRITHHQLLAVRRENGRQFHLGMVQWIRIDAAGELQCGVKIFPGTPEAITVRPSNFGVNEVADPVRALILPEVPAPATPATIVLPAGWFQSGRFLEIQAERRQVAKLLHLLDKGSDFERGTMTIV